jgi:hypothetical protein
MSNFSVAARSAVRAFVGTAIVTYIGLYQVPDVGQKGAAYLAALTAGGTAVLRLLQVKFPALSFGRLLAKVGLADYTAIVDSFARAFLSSLTVFGIGVLQAPDLHLERAAISAAIVGAATSGVRAVEGLFTKGEPPFKGIG